MEELFVNESKNIYQAQQPLAQRMRPSKISDLVGQDHLFGEEGPLAKFFESREFPSMIFWGPPGSGKTTIALLISEIADYQFTNLSAVDSGVKEVRAVISNAQRLQRAGKRTLLFIDEIHRFNKSQQDALLHAVEAGTITLIGATTENPSFEVNSALLSRCQVYHLKFLENEDIHKIVDRAIKEDLVLKKNEIEIEDWEFLLNVSAGDARVALNAIELAHKMASRKSMGKIIITNKLLERALQQKTFAYDKKGESHYDTISAFIKSLRGSDPDAALLYLAKMLEAGEEPRFIARRMVVFASEDIGNADPFAITLAISVFQAVEMIGLPEAAINLAQGVTYLASSPKSNASYMGLEHARGVVKNSVNLIVPMRLRNAPTQMMKEEGYHAGYQYPHSHEGHFIRENYFPDGMEPVAYYKPGNFGREATFAQRLKELWKDRYGKE
jgi:putative ATPase